MGKKKSEEFTLIVRDAEKDLETVKENLEHSDISYELIENRWSGPYGNKRSQATCVIRTSSKSDAKQLRKIIGCTYTGIMARMYEIKKEPVEVSDSKLDILNEAASVLGYDKKLATRVYSALKQSGYLPLWPFLNGWEVYKHIDCLGVKSCEFMERAKLYAIASNPEWKPAAFDKYMRKAYDYIPWLSKNYTVLYSIKYDLVKEDLLETWFYHSVSDILECKDVKFNQRKEALVKEAFKIYGEEQYDTLIAKAVSYKNRVSLWSGEHHENR